MGSEITRRSFFARLSSALGVICFWRPKPQTITISGSVMPEYNGTFDIQSVDLSEFVCEIQAIEPDDLYLPGLKRLDDITISGHWDS